MDNRLYILSSLDLVQLPVQFLIVDTVEILPPVCLLDVLLPRNIRRNYTVLHCMYFSGDILLQCYSVRILEGDLYCSA
jgi:hypothetical protein